MLWVLLMYSPPSFAEGAVAVGLSDKNIWRVGLSANKPDASAAMVSAVETCQAETKRPCTVIFTFRNQCVSVATKATPHWTYYIGLGTHPAEAATRALVLCGFPSESCAPFYECDGNPRTTLDILTSYWDNFRSTWVPSLQIAVHENIILLSALTVIILSLISCFWYIRRLRRKLIAGGKDATIQAKSPTSTAAPPPLTPKPQPLKEFDI